MKKLITLFLAVSSICLQFANAQQATPSSLTGLSTAALLTAGYSAQLKSTADKSFHFSMDGGDKCSKYTMMKKLGLGLTIAGGASLVTGLAVMVAGEVSYTSELIIAGGVIFGLVGIPATGAGIPLLIIGSRKSKQYCYNSTLNLSVDKNGVGMACIF